MSQQPRPARRRVAPLVAGWVFCGLATAALPVAAQVTYFDKPPTAAELRRALMGGAAPSTATPATSRATEDASGRPSGVRTRGIVWKQSGLPANDASSQPAPGAAQSAAAPVESTVNPQLGGPAAGMPINFASGSANLSPDSFGFLETVAEVMRSDPSMSLVIEGHTDATGSYRRNMVLSWERAMGVYRALVETYGIEPTRLLPQGKGPTEPMPGTSPADGANRRVQFRLQG